MLKVTTATSASWRKIFHLKPLAWIFRALKKPLTIPAMMPAATNSASQSRMRSASLMEWNT